MRLNQFINSGEIALQEHAPFSLEESLDRFELSKGYSQALSSELIQLQNESDPELRSEGLLNVAVREELRGNQAFAMEAYAWLSEHGSAYVRVKAEERLALLGGRGAFGQRTEQLLRGFAKEASDPVMLLAMGVGGGVYKATKLATMSRLVGSSGYLGRGIGLRLAGSVAGYALEAPAFTAVGRLGRGEDLIGSGFQEELLSSYLVLGAMKTVGGLSREYSRGIGHPRLERLAGDVGLYGGILLGHKLETVAGLRDWHSGGQEWVDSLGMFVQLKASGRILNHVGGERYRGMERELEYRSEHLANWGAIHRAANDGEYINPISRIGRVSEASEQAANEGNYGLQEAGLMPMAVGGEVFEVGEHVTKLRLTPSPEVLETGLRVFNMAEGSESSGPGLLGRMGARIRGFFIKAASPTNPFPALPLQEPQIQAVQSREVGVILLPLIPDIKLKMPKTVLIPGGIRATGSVESQKTNPPRWREVPPFELAIRAVTNHEVKTYIREYQDYPMGLILRDGEKSHLLARGATWDMERETTARSSLERMFEKLAESHPYRDSGISKIPIHLALINLLDAIRSRHPRAPIFHWDKVLEMKVTDWDQAGEEHLDYKVFRKTLADFDLEPSFELLCLLCESLQNHGQLKELTFERQRVVPDNISDKLRGSKRMAKFVSWYHAVGIANALGGRLPTVWEREVAARGPAALIKSIRNLDNFENFFLEKDGTTRPPISDLMAVRHLIASGLKVYGYRKYASRSGGLGRIEHWSITEILPKRAGGRPKNRYGLRGMMGNWEWTGSSDKSVVFRHGGDWLGAYYEEICRATFHSKVELPDETFNVGLRVAVTPHQSLARKSLPLLTFFPTEALR